MILRHISIRMSLSLSLALSLCLLLLLSYSIVMTTRQRKIIDKFNDFSSNPTAKNERKKQKNCVVDERID